MGEPATDTLCCPTCGYNLTGLPQNRCPECGTVFDRGRLQTGGEPMSDRRAAWLMIQAPLLFAALGLAIPFINLAHGGARLTDRLVIFGCPALAAYGIVNSFRLTRGLLVRRLHRGGVVEISTWLLATVGICIGQLLLAGLGFFATLAISTLLTGRPLW